MARPRLTESARVTIGLKVSEADAARIDEVLARPEFAGWSRAEWCREIIRTALRYYVGDAPAPDPGADRASVRPASAQPEPAEPRRPPQPRRSAEPRRPAEPPEPSGAPEQSAAAGSAGPAAGTPGPAAGPGASLDAPGPSAQAECQHPAEARDWQTGTCAACGAILWD